MEKNIQDKSKTQIKKEAEELQKLGVELIKLPEHQLERMDIPDVLRNALIEAKSITSNIAGRRQRQFIGALMRDVDPKPIRLALLQTNADLPMESAMDKEARIWLNRLLKGNPDDLEEFISAFPGMERQRLRQLLRNIKKEKTTRKSLKALEQLVMKSISNK